PSFVFRQLQQPSKSSLFPYTTLFRSNENDIFWINFIAYESDGNFFKSTEVIKDVSRFHFEKLITALSEVDEQFRQSGFVDWNARSEEHTSELQSRFDLVCRLLLDR